MRFKRLLALLLAAALALSLLAGCGGSKALSQVIVDLLDGLYSNVSVEADSDLTAALKQAAAEGGTEEEILSRMIEILNLNGGSITFTWLGSGQQGDHAVTLYFQTGTDPDAAARNALAQWAGTLGTLPDDGSYQGDVAMIESENGYYIALDVEVLKAGKPDKPEKPEEPDDGLIHADGMAYDPDQGSATISGENGLTSLVETLQKVADESGTTLADTIKTTNITLTADATLPADWPYDAIYEATFDGGNHTISGVKVSNSQGFNGMFSELYGTVKNVQFEDVSIIVESDAPYNGAVAGVNNGGTIENCVVLSGTISGAYAGGLVGWNAGEIKDCESAATINGSGQCTGGITGYNGGSISNSTNTSIVKGEAAFVGGIAGTNGEAGTISECTSSGSVQAEDQESVGGIAGTNYGIITDSSCLDDVTGGFYVGGIAGSNDLGLGGIGQITNCYVKADVTGTHPSSGGVGGIVGANTATIEACHAEGKISSLSSTGYVGGVAGLADYMSGVSSSKIAGCYFSGAVSGTQYVGGVAGKDSPSTSIQGCYAILQGGINLYCIVGADINKNTVSGTVNACYWTGTAVGDTHSGIHEVTDWAEATADMNAACGNLYDTTGTGAPKLNWEN